MKNFIKNNWWKILNVIVLFVIYGVNDGNVWVELFTGLWIFTTLARYFYRWFTKGMI